MSNLIEEGVSAFSIGDEVDRLILKGEVSPVEELRNSFEVGLNIDVTKKPSGNANQLYKVYFLCTNGKECASCKCLEEHEHKGGFRSFKLVVVISHDECSQVEQGKSALDLGELKLCKASIKCVSFPCSMDSSVSSHNVSNDDDSRKAESEILNGNQ